MILANMYVGERIFRSFPQAALLRRHPLPQASQFESFHRFAQALGLPPIDVSSNRALAKSLAQLESTAEADELNYRILKAMTVRAMSEAKYFCTGDFTESDFYHYGLAADFYTYAWLRFYILTCFVDLNLFCVCSVTSRHRFVVTPTLSCIVSF
jgi:exosome complex exonuclease DIS3/RRP44